jgi:hypothetical protein
MRVLTGRPKKESIMDGSTTQSAIQLVATLFEFVHVWKKILPTLLDRVYLGDKGGDHISL